VCLVVQLNNNHFVPGDLSGDYGNAVTQYITFSDITDGAEDVAIAFAEVQHEQQVEAAAMHLVEIANAAHVQQEIARREDGERLAAQKEEARQQKAQRDAIRFAEEEENRRQEAVRRANEDSIRHQQNMQRMQQEFEQHQAAELRAHEMRMANTQSRGGQMPPPHVKPQHHQ
jgi:hypothetical protein